MLLIIAREQSPYVANNSQGAESYVANNSQTAKSSVMFCSDARLLSWYCLSLKAHEVHKELFIDPGYEGITSLLKVSKKLRNNTHKCVRFLGPSAVQFFITP